jgi:hypothetical protein
MGVRQTSFASIKAFTHRLTAETPNRLHGLYTEATGKATVRGSYAAWVNDFDSVMQQLSGHCLQQRAWEIQHSLFPGRGDAQLWKAEAESNTELLYSCWMRVMKSGRCPAGPDSDDMEAWFDCVEMFVTHSYQQQKSELMIALSAKTDEAIYAAKKQGLTAVQKYLIPAITGGLGIGGTLLIKHFFGQ